MLGVVFLILLALILVYQLYRFIKNIKEKNYRDRYYLVSLIVILIINLIVNKINNIEYSKYINYLCAFTIVTMIIMIIFQAIYLNKDIVLKYKKSVIVFIVIVVTIIATVIFIKYPTKDYELTNIYTNEVVDILENVDNNENKFILIGRPTCKDCVSEKPKIESLLKEYKIEAFYYDTDVARSENEDLMKDIIKKLEIKFVPTIVYMEGNEIKEKFTGKDVTNDFKTWLEEDYSI